MQIALMLEYQKSVNLHTLNRLHTWLVRYPLSPVNLTGNYG
jgi:hypothetical protein